MASTSVAPAQCEPAASALRALIEVANSDADDGMPILVEIRCQIIDLTAAFMVATIPQRFVPQPHWSLWQSGSDGDVIEFRGQAHVLQKQQIVCIPPGNAFTYTTLGVLSATRLGYTLPDFDHDLVREYFFAPVPLPLFGLLNDLELDRTWSLSAVARLQSRILDCTAMLLDRVPTGSVFFRSHRGSVISVLRPALTYITQNVGNKLSVEILAGVSGVTPNYFCKLFRRGMGKTPSLYIRQLRVSLAAERLRLGSESIEQVATDLGFVNRFHFSRVFSEVIGIPPARYRRTIRLGSKLASSEDDRSPGL